MSRCFPFPPPGYERKNKQLVSDEAALIQESIKREQDKVEKERKKERKRKKEKKRKEQEEKFSLKGAGETKKHKHKGEGSSADYQKQKNCETEQLERSGLSEEHGPPSTKLCDSSDSTQNSGKRKKPSLPLEGNHGQSTMLRIRLPIVGKQKDTEELHAKEQLCPSTVRAENTSFKRAKIDPSADTKQPSTVSGKSLVPARCSSAPGMAAAADIGLIPSLKQSSSIKRAKVDACADIKQPSTVSGRSLALARCSSALGTAAAVDIDPNSCLKQSSSIKRAKIDPSGDIKQSSTVSGRALVPGRCSAALGTAAAAAEIGPSPSLKESSSISSRLKDTAQCSSEPGMAVVVGSHPSLEQPCSTSGRTEVPVQDSSAAVAPGELSISEISSLSDKQLRRVLQKWIPPVIEMEPESDDMDWLFNVLPRSEPVMPKVSHVATCHEGSSLWPPQARYLPEVEIYALPYTVPF